MQAMLCVPPLHINTDPCWLLLHAGATLGGWATATATTCSFPQAINALSGKRIAKMACGDTHTLAVTDSGELYSFGRNQNGQLGLGTTSDAITPQPVEALKVCLPCCLLQYMICTKSPAHCCPCRLAW